MKKALVLILVLITVATMLASCGKKLTECTFCEEKKFCKTEEIIFGKEIHYCKDCEEDIDDLKKAFLGE